MIDPGKKGKDGPPVAGPGRGPGGAAPMGPGGNSPVSRNHLATGNILPLILQYAIPFIISQLTSAVYNIVDQIYIGHSVGFLGNAATNVAFPLTTFCVALSLLFGVGSASRFSISLGKGRERDAEQTAGTGIVLLFFFGIVYMVLAFLFLEPLLALFGATENIMPYALDYTRIVVWGFPFLIFANGTAMLVRADGSPKFAMASLLTGAILNVVLDPIFIFGLHMGMKGAALATIIGQIVSFFMILRYCRRFKHVKLSRAVLKVRFDVGRAVAALGAAAFLNQVCLIIVQALTNNTLKHYGALSQYGSEIPIASVGVIMKVYFLMMTFVIGVAQGCQPIYGFNYGARRYERVKKTYRTALPIELGITCVFFLLFQVFPRFILSIFGSGSELYFEFGTRYLRIYYVLIFSMGIIPMTANFFSAIGKPKQGTLVTSTKNLIVFVPMMLLLPMKFGIEGVYYVGPIVDSVSIVVAVLLARREMKELDRLSAEKEKEPAPGFAPEPLAGRR